MLSSRIKERISSYSIIGIGYVKNHCLRFHKISIDQSGKADAYYLNASEEKVWGVIGEVDEKSKNTLDKIEGLGKGYNQKTLTIHMQDGKTIQTLIYVADKDYIDSKLKPYDWYKEIVLRGSIENALPNEYIKKIEGIESIFDKNEERREINFKIIINTGS